MQYNLKYKEKRLHKGLHIYSVLLKCIASYLRKFSSNLCVYSILLVAFNCNILSMTLKQCIRTRQESNKSYEVMKFPIQLTESISIYSNRTVYYFNSY